MENWQPLNRWALLNILRVKANERFRSKKALDKFLSGDVRSLRSDPIRNRLSWDRMIQWLGKLGFTVEFRLVPKKLVDYSAPGAGRDTLAIRIHIPPEEPLGDGSQRPPLGR